MTRNTDDVIGYSALTAWTIKIEAVHQLQSLASRWMTNASSLPEQDVDPEDVILAQMGYKQELKRGFDAVMVRCLCTMSLE